MEIKDKKYTVLLVTHDETIDWIDCYKTNTVGNMYFLESIYEECGKWVTDGQDRYKKDAYTYISELCVEYYKIEEEQDDIFTTYRVPIVYLWK